MVVIGSVSPPLYTAAAPVCATSLTLRNLQASSQTHIKFPRFSHTHISNLKFPRSSHRTVVALGSRSSRDPEETGFVDENGVVDDMSGYLNYLSLEYDTVWDTKPSWCQPWTIALTGVSVIGFSWISFKSEVITAMAAVIIGAWWYIFLYSYPKEYSDMIAERRKKVTSGVEDTFGTRKGQ